MPTIITHAITAIPFSLAFSKKESSRRLIILSILFSVLPDLDGIGYFLGIPYDSLFGHRGFSHSFCFVAILGLLFVYIYSSKINFKSKKFFFLFLYFFIIGSIHILLDAMTNGGLGVALLSPFSNDRFFFPWRPIQVSAISPFYFFQLKGAAVIRFELLYLLLPSILLSALIFFKKRYGEKN